MIICIPVRMNSKRLPGKAMMDLWGKPLFEQVYLNVIKSGFKAVVCTSSESDDGEIVDRCLDNHIPVKIGDINDPMGRMIDAADKFDRKTICRVTGDNPLTDWRMIKPMYEAHIARGNDYTYTNVPRGTRPEIIHVEALRFLHDSMKAKGEKELFAVNEYLTYELMRFPKTQLVEPPSMTVDTMEDLERMRESKRP